MNRWDRNNEFHSHRCRLVGIVTEGPGGAVKVSGIVVIAAALHRAGHRTSNPAIPFQSGIRDTIEPVRPLILLLGMAFAVGAQSGENVLLVVNGNAPISRQIAEYYRPRRSVPVKNVCYLRTTAEEEITWSVYEDQIERPIREFLERNGLAEKVLYIVTTQGVPLKVDGPGSGLTTERCSVDSELALLYGKRKGAAFGRTGGIANPLFMKRDEPFRHPRFPMYLVTRLAAYDLADVKAMINRSLAARNRGRFVVDLNGAGGRDGNN